MIKNYGNEPAGGRRGRKWLAYAVLFAVGAGLAAALGPELPQDYGRLAHRKWQEFMWDNWSKGVIAWGRYSLQTPVGRYGWILHENGDLLVFPRDSSGIVSIVIKKAERAKWPFRRYAEQTCVEKKLCSRFEQKTVSIGGRQADVIVFEDTGSGITVRSNAFLYLKDPEILLSIGAEKSDELGGAAKFSEGLLEQIVRQTKA